MIVQEGKILNYNTSSFWVAVNKKVLTQPNFEKIKLHRKRIMVSKQYQNKNCQKYQRH